VDTRGALTHSRLFDHYVHHSGSTIFFPIILFTLLVFLARSCIYSDLLIVSNHLGVYKELFYIFGSL